MSFMESIFFVSGHLLKNAIRINMEDQVVIFNYESEEVTAELCDTMEDFIAEKLTEEQVK